MSKAWQKSSWILGLTALLSLLAFSGQRVARPGVDRLQIRIDYQQGHYFVNETDIEKIIRSAYPDFEGESEREINTKMLEDRLDNHPAIRKAEVYSAINGILNIEVRQKIPVYRVLNSARGYYIDEQGDSMVLSERYSAPVPLVTGAVNDSVHGMVHRFYSQSAPAIFDDGFFPGLHIESNGHWILYPRPGRHSVELGKPVQLEDKLQRLAIFYREVTDRQNIDSIKSVNLAYARQVICTKY